MENNTYEELMKNMEPKSKSISVIDVDNIIRCLEVLIDNTTKEFFNIKHSIRIDDNKYSFSMPLTDTLAEKLYSEGYYNGYILAIIRKGRTIIGELNGILLANCSSHDEDSEDTEDTELIKITYTSYKPESYMQEIKVCDNYSGKSDYLTIKDLLRIT